MTSTDLPLPLRRWASRWLVWVADVYCQENPCGLPQSVRAPRANWCPGTITPPTVLEPEELALPGRHTLRYAINKVAAGGSWRMSATYFAFGD